MGAINLSMCKAQTEPFLQALCGFMLPLVLARLYFPLHGFPLSTVGWIAGALRERVRERPLGLSSPAYDWAGFVQERTTWNLLCKLWPKLAHLPI